MSADLTLINVIIKSVHLPLYPSGTRPKGAPFGDDKGIFLFLFCGWAMWFQVNVWVGRGNPFNEETNAVSRLVHLGVALNEEKGGKYLKQRSSL
jgi:hypothetical protein